METVGLSPTQQVAVRSWAHWLPLAGVATAVLTIAADLTIGDFPDGDTSPAKLATFYADHHTQVGRGGTLMGVAAFTLGLFAVALVVRTLHQPVVAALIGVGGAATVAHEEWSAATFSLMGTISTEHGVTPQAVQSWHLAASELGLGVGMAILMLGFALAGITTRALPTWLGWAALVLAAAQFASGAWGFWATNLALLWMLVAGIVVSRRPVA